MRISPATLNDYMKCPRKVYFKFNNYLKMAPFFEESVNRGKLVHQIIQEFYQGEVDRLTETEAKLRISDIYHKHVLIHDEKTEYELLNFVAFESFRKEQGFRVVETEKEYSTTYRDVTVHGIIDMMMIKDQEKVVVDWKTGYQGIVTEEIRNQLSVYKWLTNADRTYVVFLDWKSWFEVDVDDPRPMLDALIDDKEFLPSYSDCKLCGYQIPCLGEKIVFHI
ncbi:MAG: PD-(D/E)XK nuclease family protein [Metallosphaera sp.]